MKIAFLINNIDNKGGTERVTTVLANKLASRRNSVSLISIMKGGNPAYKLNELINLYSLHYEGKGRVHSRVGLPILIYKIVKKLKIKVLVCVDVGPYTYLKTIRSILECKVVVWEHFNYYNFHSLRDKRKKECAARYADAFVVLGYNDFISYKQHVKKIKKLTYIYNPVTVDVKGKTRLGEKHVISVGRLVKQKGFDILLDVWKKVKMDKYSEEWVLDIYGDGPEREVLESKIRKLCIEDVNLNSYTKNITAKYLSSSIFVLSSRFEGFVLVLLEAQACGLPTISFDIKEGPREIITDGVNGFLVPPFDVNKMASKILDLMKNEDKLRYFSENSRKDLGKFDLEKIVDKWELLFNEIT